jgi:hypothetical protein
MIGLAYGLSGDQMGFGQEFVSAQHLLDILESPPPEETRKKRRPRRDKKALPMPRMS